MNTTQLLVHAAQEARNSAQNLLQQGLEAATAAQEAESARIEYERESVSKLRIMLRQALVGIEKIVAFSRSKPMQELLLAGEKVAHHFSSVCLFHLNIDVKAPKFLDWAWLNYSIEVSLTDVTIKVEQCPVPEELSFSLDKPAEEVDHYEATRGITRAQMLRELMSLHQRCEGGLWSSVEEFEGLSLLLEQSSEDFLSIDEDRHIPFYHRNRLHWLALLIRCKDDAFLEALVQRAVTDYASKLREHAARIKPK